jgi:hypothetical protein
MAAMLEQQRKKADDARAAEEALKKGLFGDPAFASTHAAVCSLLELLVLAVRDRDAAGWKYFATQRPRVLELAAKACEPATRGRMAARNPGQGTAAAASPPEADASFVAHAAQRQASLEAVAELAAQALLVHRAKAKSHAPDLSIDEGGGKDGESARF